MNKNMNLPAEYAVLSEEEMTYTPVSYTHLDVYKRQREDRSAGQADPGLHRIRISNQKCRWSASGIFDCLDQPIGRQLPGIEGLVQVVAVPADLYEQAAGGQIPVSYTHLDVYKRQSLHLAPLPGELAAPERGLRG